MANRNLSDNMKRLLLKRKSSEVKSFEAWLTQGRGGFHFEHLEIFGKSIKAILHFFGFLKRGEQNVLDTVIKKMTFKFERLPAGFSGFTILHLSDIHADCLDGFAENICRKIQDIKADICVMTGDYRFEVYGPCHDVYFNMEKILSATNTRYGVVAVLGNHDFYEEALEFERMGVKMLINESHEIRHANDSIWLVGLDDPHYYGCDDLEGALTDVPKDAFKILLVHTPEIIPEAANNNIDLYLCGHTHGGQICLPFSIPILVNANCPRKYTKGTWQYQDLQGYTSAGAGSSCVAVRFNCRPEIGLIELIDAGNSKC
jgi:hypothetical protein